MSSVIAGLPIGGSIALLSGNRTEWFPKGYSMYGSANNSDFYFGKLRFFYIELSCTYSGANSVRTPSSRYDHN